MERTTTAQLRKRITLIYRTLDEDDHTGLDSQDREESVWAEVKPLGTMAFLHGRQTGHDATHRIVIRWRDYLDTNTLIRHETLRPDQTVRVDQFRVVRFAELAGEKAYAVIEAVLVNVDGQTVDA